MSDSSMSNSSIVRLDRGGGTDPLFEANYSEKLDRTDSILKYDSMLGRTDSTRATRPGE